MTKNMIFKTISVRQPWAWALLHGKPVENRTWGPSHRGILLIHAAIRFDPEGYRWIKENKSKLTLDSPIPLKDQFTTGGIVGGATLTDVVEDHPSPWFSGPKGLVLEDPFELPFFPISGHLGLFDVELPESYHKHMKGMSK